MRVSIQTTFSNLSFPEKGSTEDVRELIRRSKQDEKAFEQLVLTYMPMAAAIACTFANNYVNYKDDIMGSAMVGLTEALLLIDSEHPNIDAYIAKTIIGKLQATVIAIPTLHVKRGITGKKYKELYGGFSVSGEPIAERMTDTFSKIRLDDYLESNVFTNRERKVIEMRLEGYNDVEIGQHFGLSKMSIGNMRKTIGKKILEIIS